MTAMVGTMLLLARKPEQLEFRPFDLCVLARQEEVEIRERLRGRPVTFSSLLPDRLTVLGSPELAAMVLHNLLDNAWRYADATPLPRVVLSTSMDGPHLARVQVWSTGTALDAALQARLFEPFASGHSRSTGLGLYICRELCQRHGASISYQRLNRPTARGDIGGNAFTVGFRRTTRPADNATLFDTIVV